MNDFQLNFEEVKELAEKFKLYFDNLIQSLEELIGQIQNIIECYVDCSKKKRIIPAKKIQLAKASPVYRVKYHARSNC